MTKAYAYLRVSGRGQVDGDGFPRQLVAVKKYAEQQGIEIAGVYSEKAVPGKTEWDDRPAWVDMLDRIVHNGVRTILIEKLDRLARDILVQEHIIADLRKRGVELISVEEPDLCRDDPTRNLMRQIMGAIAEYDRCMIVLKLRGARQRSKARDGRCEGRKPFGYHPGELATLTFMRERARMGDTPTQIARALNEAGRVNRSGGSWHPFAVSRILRRDVASILKGAKHE